jgi:2-aminoadipate transaminase
VPPRRFRTRALRAKQVSDLQSNSLAQAVVEHYLEHHDFEARLVTLRRFYARRARRLADAVKSALPSWQFQFPEGGFALWAEADAKVDERAFLEIAIAEGVSFDPASLFRIDPAQGPTAVRLCFSLVPESQMEEGARRLARAWQRVTRKARGQARGEDPR